MMNEKFEQLRNPNAGTPQTLDLATITWIKSFEEKQRPETLGEKFPRIANRLAAIWPSPSVALKYLDELMFDDRGQRQGFPMAIGLELATLKEIIVNRQEQAASVNTAALRR